MANASVLVIDDSAEMVTTLARYLRGHGWNVRTALGGAEALDLFAREPVDVVLTDLRMEGVDGLDVLEEIRRTDGQTPVVLMTAFGSIESAVDAIGRGAHDYLAKPFNMTTLRLCLERAVSKGGRPGQKSELLSTARARFSARGLIGTSPAMRKLVCLIDRAARSDRPVLILGETGTGKELVARAIHLEGDRRDAPFVTASCAALPEAAFESQAFGSAAGGSLDAWHARRGLFAEADRGTILLDEVAELPFTLQAKLLRFLDTGEIHATGDDSSRNVDVRCIASTHGDLETMVRTGLFREDLFFRLNVISIRVPPLRERREDLPLLVEHFLTRAQEHAEDPARRRLTREALRVIEAHAWPGNIRELENVIERLVVSTSRPEIDADATRAALAPLALNDPAAALADAHLRLDEVEDRYIEAVLRQAHGNKANAAAILGVDSSTLYRRDARKRRR